MPDVDINNALFRNYLNFPCSTSCTARFTNQYNLNKFCTPRLMTNYTLKYTTQAINFNARCEYSVFWFVLSYKYICLGSQSGVIIICILNLCIINKANMPPYIPKLWAVSLVLTN